MLSARWSVAVVAAVSLILTGCAAAPTETPVTPTPTSTVLSEKSPEFDPDGSAAINKPYFDWVILTYLVGKPKYNDESLVSALVAAGFEKDSIEITPSTTGTNLAADSITVAVAMGDNCLIGQRMRNDEYASSVEKLLSSGTCLVGETQPIN